MKLLTKELRERRVKNRLLCQRMTEANNSAVPDFLPVVKLFTPDPGATCLLTKIEPENAAHISHSAICKLLNMIV